MNVTGDALATIRGSGLGLYSFLFRYMYGAVQDVLFVRQESLRQQLSEVLEGLGIALDPAMTDYLRHAPPQNASVHEHYSQSYTGQLAELVGEQDASFVQRFGYAFEPPCANAAQPTTQGIA